MTHLLDLHVQYWEECEVCTFEPSLTQEEAEEYNPSPCPNCEEVLEDGE